MDLEEENETNLKVRCKCCLNNFASKSLWEEYYYNDEKEVYGEMFMECFALRWEVEQEEYICDSCIQRLRDAVKLKIEFLAVQELLQENVLLNAITVNGSEVEEDGSLEELNLEILNQEEYDEEEEFSEKKPKPRKRVHGRADFSVKRADRKCPKRKKMSERNKTYKLYTKQDLEDAKDAVRSKRMKSSEAAVTFGVPDKTLRAKLLDEDRVEVRDALHEKHMKFIKEIETILQYTNAMPFKTKTTKYYCAYCTSNRTFFEDLDLLRNHTKSKHNIIRDLEGVMRPLWLNEVIKLEITGLECTTCSTEIEHWNDMFAHFADTHNIEFDESYTRVIPFSLTTNLKCVLCRESMSNYGQLDAHMNAHFCNYICYECGDPFLSSSRLDRHLKVHKIGKFPCETCGKVFTLDIYRSKHISLVHNHEFNVKCLYCPQKFLGTLQRHKHVTKDHPEKVKVFSCEFCEKTYTWKSNLLIHKKRTHLKEKKHKCSHCDKAFYMKFELRNHMVKHKGKQIFACSLCDEVFRTMVELKEHWRVHAS